MRASQPSFLLICLLGLLGSAWLGWLARGSMGPSEVEEDPELARSGGVKGGQVGIRKLGPPPEVGAALRAISSSDDLMERMRSTIALAQSLPLAELERWLKESWFSLREGPELGLFHEVAKERWRSEDPLGYVAWVKEDDPDEGAEILASWIGSDLERFHSYFAEVSDSEFRLDVLEKLASSQPQWALEQALKQAGTISTDLFEELFRKLASESPETLQRSRDLIPLGARSLVESLLSRVRLEESFDREFDHLLERPDGFRLLFANGLVVEGAGSKVLARLDEFPTHWKSQLVGALSYFLEDGNLDGWLATDFEGLGFSATEVERMRGTILQTMLQSDPMHALRQLQASGLGERERRKFFENLFFSGSPESFQGEAWKELLSESDLELVAKLENRSRDAGEAVVPLDDPKVWLSKVREGEAADSKYEFNEALNEQWSGPEVAQLAEYFQATQGKERLHLATLLADPDSYEFQQRTAQLRGDAIRAVVVAGEQIENSDGVEAAAKHAVYWVINEPAKAQQWVEGLPSGEAKKWARRNMAAAWNNYDPEGVSEWITNLPEAAKRDVELHLKNEGRLLP